MGRIVMGYWNCPSCGNANIPGSSQSCPSCGKTRDNTVKFNAPNESSSRPKVYVTDPVKAESLRNSPDWHCSFCDNLVNHYQERCPSCGHTREESDKNYYQLHSERRSMRFSSDGSVQSSSSDDEEHHRNEDDDDEEEDEQPHSVRGGRMDTAKRILIGILIAALIVGAIVGAWFIFSPKERYITVEDIYWSRAIDIQEYRTVHESDWYVPAGGRVQYTKDEIHHYDRVFDHYETVTKARTVTTYRTEYSYRDLGNGYFEEEEYQVPEYHTEYETEQEPVYRQDPVYRTKYYYDIERWVYHRSVRSGEHNQEPYWPSYTLADNERTSTTYENYMVKASYEDKTADYSMRYQDWIETYIGNELHVMVHFGGRIELLMDEPESEPTKIPEP